MRSRTAGALAVLTLIGCGSGGGGGSFVPVGIATTTLPEGTVGVAYSASIRADGGTPPYTWALVNGSVPPPGLALDTTAGVLAGNPTAAGSFGLTVRVTDSRGGIAERAYNLVVNPAPPGPLSIATSSLPAGTAAVSYGATLQASGGVTPYAWSVATGALPAGLALDAATGTISGTPAAAETAAFTARVQDNTSTTAEQSLSIVIGPNPWIEQIPNGSANSPVARQYAAMVWDGRRVILFGGEDAAYRYNDVWWYEPAGNTWTQKIPHGSPGSPPPRSRHAMVWDGTRVIMFGGGPNQPVSDTFNDLWWYDPTTNTWTPKIPQWTPGSPEARYGHTFVWDGTRAILFGGDIDFGGPDHSRNDVWWYNPTLNQWTQPVVTTSKPGVRLFHDSVWDGMRMIVFQGMNPLGDGYTDFWWYDPASDGWTDATRGDPRPEQGRYGHSLVWDGTRAILFGGSDGGHNVTPLTQHELWQYYPATTAWTNKSAVVPSRLAPIRTGHRAVWDGARMIVFGGHLVEGSPI